MANCGSILIVDDDAGIRQLVATVLGQAGYETTQAQNAAEALAAVRQTPCALVVLDVLLPDLSGYEVCRELKDEFGDRLPIIFISGERGEPYDRVAGLLIGADDFVTKPFAPDELLARVRSLVSRTRARGNGNGDEPNGSQLTTREGEVLRLLADGLPQSEIADRLVITERTVGKHIEHVLQKLGVHSRAAAVAEAYRRQLL